MHDAGSGRSPRAPDGALDRARKRRARTRTLLVRTTFLTGLGAAGFFLLFGLRRDASPRAVEVRMDGGLHEGPVAAPAAPPVITLQGGRVLLEGVEVGTTGAIVQSGRVGRVDGLFEALKRRRLDHDPSDRAVIIDATGDTPAIVVKSVFHTASFAGYSDVSFAIREAGAP